MYITLTFAATTVLLVCPGIIVTGLNVGENGRVRPSDISNRLPNSFSEYPRFMCILPIVMCTALLLLKNPVGTFLSPEFNWKSVR